MKENLIHQYYNNLDRTLQYGKSYNEQSIRNHFWLLLNEYARKYYYEVIPEIPVLGTKGKKVYPDGTVKNVWGLDVGYWESKDEKDDINAEIDSKIKKGYPISNILFEDSNIAYLYQRGEEVAHIKIREPEALDYILTQFLSFKSDTVYKFEDAINKFKADIPIISSTLRDKIIDTRKRNDDFIIAQNAFLLLCKDEINPDITIDDIREMLIQHILTSDIFNKIFDDSDFHRHNTIASELEKLVNKLFDYTERKNLLLSIEHYYEAINASAASIIDHHEKQKFLKVLYENFYKVYNPKAADRLGVVYTPNEIVDFMIESTDYLLNKYFSKTLADKEVEILDPATGTGTFLTKIIDYIPKQYLTNKYKNEIHANEVAILPYYIANLNIEYTFQQKMGYYEEFKNICFVDTLDNIDALHYVGKQHNLFGISNENSDRIIMQNRKKISVIIGNPPYNANQKNENEDNKNREYPAIDKRIKETYIKYSTAQKTKVYDMYSRFYRWASDRLEKNGIIAFITNRSFIDSRTFDGFRKCIQDDFTDCFIVDTRSDVRANPKIAGITHNVFGIQTGVAIMFLVRKENRSTKCDINYFELNDFWRREEKLDWLKSTKFADILFQKISPDKNNNWITIEENDFNTFLPLVDKEVKFNKKIEAIFKLFTLGTVSNRDEWVYDLNKEHLRDKIIYFIKSYNDDVSDFNSTEKSRSQIKYTRDLKKRLIKGLKLSVSESEFRQCLYRPFVIQNLYYASELNEMRYQTPLLFPTKESKNVLIAISTGSKPFSALASKYLVDLHFNGDSQCIPMYIYSKDGYPIENITDWGYSQFINHYSDNNIKKENIFHYIYAILNDPNYLEKYKLNLKHGFPRLPFHKNFWQWATWGAQLMELHVNFESAKPYTLTEISTELKVDGRQNPLYPVTLQPEKLFIYQPKIKVKLKVDKINGVIKLDENTSLIGIPSEAWDYKVGTRSALEWILDQYKEKKHKDPTISDKFNTYKFADHKKNVIELLKRVCTVSVETVKIMSEMAKSIT